MLRCTIEIVPFGNEELKKTIGIVEIGNDTTGNKAIGNYTVILKKTAPWNVTLKDTWRLGHLELQSNLGEYDDVITGKVEGFERQKRGPYDLLFKALESCGLGKR